MDVTMPQLGETVTEGTITRWLKQPGDPIKTDEPLFEVSTDKVDSEVPSPTSGVLAEIRVGEGETAAVGTVLAVISDAAAGAAPPAPASAPPAAAPPLAPVPAATPMPAAGPTPVSRPVEPVVAEPDQFAPPPVHAVPTLAPSPVGADETDPGVTVSRPIPPTPVSSASPPTTTDPALTSPVVRRLIAEHGVDPADITGTGQGGRITRKDVLEAAARTRDATLPGGPPRAATAAPVITAVPEPPAPTLAPVALPATPVAPAAPVAPTPTPAPAAAPAPAGQDRGLVVPFSNMRKRTAEHMVRSKATSAHASTSVEVDYERVERVRASQQADWKAREGFTLTYLPFIARAFCDTVDEFPHVNASVVDDTLVVHRDVHLSIAVDLQFGGLIAPVVRDADGKRLRLIAREIRDLAERARAKQLGPDEVLGGTFTITNPGPYGTYQTIPIINQPQVAILATDGVTKRPRVVEGPDGADMIAVRHIGMLGLTWDHRAFDGAYAAAFLSGMRERLEQHDWVSELD